MAHFKPRLLTEPQLRRHEECAVENAKMADCWSGEQVVFLTFNFTEEYKCRQYTLMPSLQLDIMTPSDKPTWPSSVANDKKPVRQLCRRTIRMLEGTKSNKKVRPEPWYMRVDSNQIFELYSDDAMKKAQGMIDELSADYAAMCVVTHDIRHTMRALEIFDMKLPAKAVFVDLIKVLEHQTRDDGVPEELAAYTDDNIAVRNGRYDRKAGVSGGRLGLPYIRLLEIVGPAAEAHRRDFQKAEKEDVALKRINGRLRNG
ncbi:hypothetical protein CcaCcLH18_08702 [Colletotrichum camelliae]|nr:hypothetical protein CcaCcLH18_08702 [Colletotrichum camelliae]